MPQLSSYMKIRLAVFPVILLTKKKKTLLGEANNRRLSRLKQTNKHKDLSKLRRISVSVLHPDGG